MPLSPFTSRSAHCHGPCPKTNASIRSMLASRAVAKQKPPCFVTRSATWERLCSANRLPSNAPPLPTTSSFTPYASGAIYLPSAFRQWICSPSKMSGPWPSALSRRISCFKAFHRGNRRSLRVVSAGESSRSKEWSVTPSHPSPMVAAIALVTSNGAPNTVWFFVKHEATCGSPGNHPGREGNGLSATWIVKGR